MPLQQSAASFLLKIKHEEDTSFLVQQLADYPQHFLFDEFENDNQKKAFWINCYNAFFLHLRRDSGIIKPDIYRKKYCTIARNVFSLDEIEHGILRRYRLKQGLGYLPDIFVSKSIRQLAVKTIDYRIHFALNCGAKSCPPIKFYTPNEIEQQLESATLAFLESETDHYTDRKEIHFTQLGRWFLGDFGGYRGIRKLIAQKLHLDTKGYKLIFKAYNWDENLDNFAESPADV